MFLLALVSGLAATAPTATAQPVNLLKNGNFEGYTAAQVPVYKYGPSGELWGRDWKGGWDAAGLASSWTYSPAGGSGQEASLRAPRTSPLGGSGPAPG
jgi:hypothetical protein